MMIRDKKNYNMIRDSISMKNLKAIIDNKQYTIVKVATNSKISESTINSYIAGQKLPSIPTLVSIADFLHCNIDYLLDRCDDPSTIDDLNQFSNDPELKQLMNNVMTLPKDKQQLVMAYVKGLLGN